MKLARCNHDGRTRIGVVAARKVIDLRRLAPSASATIREVLTP